MEVGTYLPRYIMDSATITIRDMIIESIKQIMQPNLFGSSHRTQSTY